MDPSVCTVCRTPVGPDAPRLGGRAFCARHYAKATGSRRALWIATGAAIAGLLLFVLAVNLLVNATGLKLTGWPLTLAGVVLALIPAGLWLIIFYAQDRLEPEPKGYVLGMFALGAFLALTIAIPVARDLLPLPAIAGLRSGRDIVIALAHAILIVGFIQEFLKYAAVRYTIFGNVEFDERIDGIIYGAAAGLGFATALNVQWIIAGGGALLGQAALRATVTALAQASFSGVTGYFLGRAKFERMGKCWLPLGLTLAAVLNGCVTFLLGEVSTSGLSFTPFRGLILAAGVALITFGVLLVLLRRANAAVLAQAKGGA
jgi:RsiW-degrading membrane proteinase PrsW (M82 family)